MSTIQENLTVLDTKIAVQGEWIKINNEEFDFKLTLESEHGSATIPSEKLVDNHYAFRDALIKCLPKGATDSLRWVENAFLGKVEYLRIAKIITNSQAHKLAS